MDALNGNLVLTYSFSGREYWTKAGRLRILPQLAMVDTSIVAKQSRRYPLDLGIPSRSITKLDIALPPGCKLEYLPGEFSKTSPWLDFSIKYNLRDNQLYFEQITQGKTRQIPLSEYSEFKSFMEDISIQMRERVIFRRD